MYYSHTNEKTLIFFFFLHGLTPIRSPIFFLPFIFHFPPLLHMQTKCTNKPFFFFFTKRDLDHTPDSLIVCLGQTCVLIFHFPQANWSPLASAFYDYKRRTILLWKGDKKTRLAVVFEAIIYIYLYIYNY